MAYGGDGAAARTRAQIMAHVAELRESEGRTPLEVSSARRSAQSLFDLADYYDQRTRPYDF